MKVVSVFLLVVACGLILSRETLAEQNRGTLSGDLVIFHAGSLAVPFKEIAAAFNREHPGVRIMREAAGSRTCARKIADLGRPCDIIASADHTVIDTLLVPEHADWNIKFAGNEMSIVFHNKSRRSKEITSGNWHEILLKKDVAFSRSDPNADPCGYRAVLTMKLAEKRYNEKGLAEKLLKKDLKYIRSKETDLLALLETGEIDYIFLYRSVAEQHGLKYLVLPDEINLKAPEFVDLYKAVAVEISGERPGTIITRRGAPIMYGVTIPNSARNPGAALAFLEFLLEQDKGMAILEKYGQRSVVPSPTEYYEEIPDTLKKFALKGSE